MFASLPYAIRVPLAIVLLLLNTLLHVAVLAVLTMLKLLVPVAGARRALSRWLVVVAESWIGVNSALFDGFTHTRWHVQQPAQLYYNRNYLVLCNHQSWIDIPVLQKLFNRRIPFLRFFLKSQLIWVPLMGPAWWALDFPFMKRHSKETLAHRPELKGQDRQATRRACEKFQHMPVSIMNFVEGTRFGRAKHDAQGSSFTHLLKPRAGGLAFVLDAMGDALHALLDVTIVYPTRPGGLMDLIAGRVREIRVHVRELPIGPELRGDYESDADFRQRFQDRINTLWLEKDAQFAAMQAASGVA